MPGGLYNRVAARGFPSQVAAGLTGAGALESQGGPADPAHGQIRYGLPPSTLTGFDPEGPGPVGVEVMADITAHGAAADPDQTPGYGPGTFRTHAAPVPGWAGSYDDHQDLATVHRNSVEIHAQSFGGQKINTFLPGQPTGETEIKWDHWEANTAELEGPQTQVPLTGPQRVLGGYDAVQGYDRRNRYGFDAGHRRHDRHVGNMVVAYLDSAERPFLIPQGSGSYVPTDAVQGPEPWISDQHAENVNYHDPSSYSPPPEPAQLQQPLVEATSWGW